ncbi:NAD(P)/FAD-dependent oxidoreductase [Endothiovibrio diazotrophicus]
MKRIVVLGSGFAALTAIHTLRKQGCKNPISVVSPHSELFFYPSLIWVPAGMRTREDLTVPLAKWYAKHDVEHFNATVSGLDPHDRVVKSEYGDIGYDYLVIASGGRFIKKLPGIENAAIPCQDFDQVARVRDRLNEMEGGHLAFGFAGNPKEPSAMRGGPMFEFLFGIDTLLRRQGRRDDFTLTFFSPASKPGQRLGEQAVERLLEEMKKRGIQTHLGHKMKAIEADKVVTEGGEIPADLTLFMPGMTGPAWAAESGLPLSAGGFILADENCRVPGFKEIFIAGDAGSFPGPDWMPKQAHMADLQAEAAAKNLLAVMNDRPAEHTFKVELLCIVDALDGGILVLRTLKRNVLFKLSLMHGIKRFFEWWYLRRYR